MDIVSRERFITLLQARGSETLREHLRRLSWEAILEDGEWAVHEGDWVSTGVWRLPTVHMLVLGSVVCDGLVDLGPETGDVPIGDRGGTLWIIGDLRCRDFTSDYNTAVFVDGSMTVSGLAITAFVHALLLVTGDFTAYFFFGQDIRADVGGRAVMEYGDGYALPLGYHDAELQAIVPCETREASLALLDVEPYAIGAELAAKLRLNQHFR